MMGLSKSALDVFKSCPRCFWLEKNAKLKRPDGIKASIMNGIDDCMKQVTQLSVEWQQPSPYLSEIPTARPFADRKRMQLFMSWRTFQATVQAGRHQVLIWGQIDDLIEWPDGTVSPHDFKSNGKERDWNEYTEKYNSLQADMYEILLKAQGLKTNGDSYFTYAWPIVDAHGKMVFIHKTVLFKTNQERALATIEAAAECLAGQEPASDPGCDYCRFVDDRSPIAPALPDPTLGREGIISKKTSKKTKAVAS